jgi:hypothetical protein
MQTVATPYLVQLLLLLEAQAADKVSQVRLEVRAVVELAVAEQTAVAQELQDKVSPVVLVLTVHFMARAGAVVQAQSAQTEVPTVH